MGIYIDALIIFVLCTVLFPAEHFDALHLTCISMIFAIFCFVMVIKKKKFSRLFGLMALVITLFNPEVSLYLPLLYYIYFFRKEYLMLGLYLVPIAGFLLTCKTHIYLWILPLLLLSLYLAYETDRRIKLQRAINEFRDDSVEKELILKERNRQLLENQDDQVYIATLKERNRIAREIHDNVGHLLSRSILQVGAMLAVCKDETLKPYLSALKESLDAAMDNIRNSVHDLHDEPVDLRQALENLVENFSFCGIHLECDISKHIPKEVKYCFLAIVKEGLNNVIKHSNATKVTITAKEHPAFYQLLIEDNGTKKKSGDFTTESEGIGLSNMRERVNVLHGNFHISHENGFRIFVSIQK